MVFNDHRAVVLDDCRLADFAGRGSGDNFRLAAAADRQEGHEQAGAENGAFHGISFQWDLVVPRLNIWIRRKAGNPVREK
jgi:hypothetical protein